MNTNATQSPARCVQPACSALDAALALVDFGPCRGAERPQDWINVAGPMCAHCERAEDVNFAAARIIAAEYRKALDVISAIEERYIDGCDTYEDWRFMGQAARDYLIAPNDQALAPPPITPQDHDQKENTIEAKTPR